MVTVGGRSMYAIWSTCGISNCDLAIDTNVLKFNIHMEQIVTINLQFGY